MRVFENKLNYAMLKEASHVGGDIIKVFTFQSLRRNILHNSSTACNSNKVNIENIKN